MLCNCTAAGLSSYYYPAGNLAAEVLLLFLLSLLDINRIFYSKSCIHYRILGRICCVYTKLVASLKSKEQPIPTVQLVGFGAAGEAPNYRPQAQGLKLDDSRLGLGGLCSNFYLFFYAHISYLFCTYFAFECAYFSQRKNSSLKNGQQIIGA